MERLKISKAYPPPYPSLGEVVLALFKFSGLWDAEPSKAPGKRGFQKELQRFAQETDLLSPAEVVDILRLRLEEALGDGLLLDVAGESLLHLLERTSAATLDNGSPWDRRETCRWFLRAGLALPLAVCVHRARLLYDGGRSSDEVLVTPRDALWFLPLEGGGRGTDPVPRVLGWWLGEAGFGSVGEFAKKVETAEKKTGVNVTTLRNWLNEDSLPAFGTLRRVKEFDLDRGEREPALKRSLILCVLVARTVQGFVRMLQDAFGEGEARAFLADFRSLYESFEAELLPKVATRLAPHRGSPRAEWFAVVDEAVGETVHQELARAGAAAEQLAPGADAGEPTTFAGVAARILQVHRAALPDNFPVLVEVALGALDLTRPESSLDPSRLRVALNTTGAAGRLGCEYLRLFLEARLALVEGHLDRAFDRYVDAFESARYRAPRPILEPLLAEAMGIACFFHTLRKDQKEARDGAWTVARYLRDWAVLHGLCGSVVHLDDRVFQELSRRAFVDHFGSILGTEEPLVTRLGPHLGLAGSEGWARMRGWKPAFRHPNSLVREFSLRDNSQLMTAIRLGQEENALRLIERGADLDFRNAVGDHALIYALSGPMPMFRVAERILDAGVALETLRSPTSRTGTTAMSLVIDRRKPALLGKILSMGCPVNERVSGPGQPTTPLYLAVLCLRSRTEELRAAPFQAPVSVRHRAIYSDVADFDEAHRGTPSDGLVVLRLLLGAGADTEPEHLHGHTALTVAAELGLTEAARLLLEHEARPNHRVAGGGTALCFSVDRDDLASAKVLLERGAFPDIVTNGRFLLDCCRSGRMRTLLLAALTTGGPKSVPLFPSRKER